MYLLPVIYSKLCDTDLVAYDNYLATVKGLAKDVKGSGVQLGTVGSDAVAGLAGAVGRDACDGTLRRVVCAGTGLFLSGESCCAGEDAMGSSGAGAVFFCGFGGHNCRNAGVDDGVSGRVDGVDGSCSKERTVCHGVDEAEVGGARHPVEVLGVNGRGANYERNRINREQKKRRKQRRQLEHVDWRVRKEGQQGSVKRELPVSNCGGPSPVDDGGKKGFWNSCSAEVRQSLIDSKARMHIADNERRTEEAVRRVKQLQSPEQILRDAMRMVGFANEQAKKQNDSKIYGWAKTVAESYAETIAKSAPTSVESFEDFVKSNSSVTSVSLETFNEVRAKLDELQKQKDQEFGELQRQKDQEIGELQRQVAILRLDAGSGSGVVKSSVSVKRGGGDNLPVSRQAHFLQVTAEKKRKEEQLAAEEKSRRKFAGPLMARDSWLFE